MGDIAELTARLEAARKARAELANERSEADVHRQLAEQVEAEERALRDEQALAAAEAEHGPVGRKILVVETDLGTVIVKRPNHVLYKKFRDQGEAKTEDLEKLVRPCVVHPTLADLDRILEELPGTLDRLADRVITLAGFRAKEVSGK